ncbi:MAG: cobalamin B12-binding domain-containing protein [Desulfobacteraceae bacterium]|nr:MAG: cobalamin B12-binding domain-containing protein [Desulfobacteraceae bacterium]
MNQRKIRVVVSKVGLDGHDRGAKVVASLLQKAGMEVVYLGMYQTVEGIVNAAVAEDADVIGVSYLSGEHLVFTPQIVAEMKKEGLDDVLFLVGGSFPPEDIPVMKEMGVHQVFRGGSLGEDIVRYIRENVRTKMQREEGS